MVTTDAREPTDGQPSRGEDQPIAGPEPATEVEDERQSGDGLEEVPQSVYDEMPNNSRSLEVLIRSNERMLGKSPLVRRLAGARIRVYLEEHGKLLKKEGASTKWSTEMRSKFTDLETARRELVHEVTDLPQQEVPSEEVLRLMRDILQLEDECDKVDEKPVRKALHHVLPRPPERERFRSKAYAPVPDGLYDRKQLVKALGEHWPCFAANCSACESHAHPLLQEDEVQGCRPSVGTHLRPTEVRWVHFPQDSPFSRYVKVDCDADGLFERGALREAWLSGPWFTEEGAEIHPYVRPIKFTALTDSFLNHWPCHLPNCEVCAGEIIYVGFAGGLHSVIPAEPGDALTREMVVQFPSDNPRRVVGTISADLSHRTFAGQWVSKWIAGDWVDGHGNIVQKRVAPYPYSDRPSQIVYQDPDLGKRYLCRYIAELGCSRHFANLDAASFHEAQHEEAIEARKSSNLSDTDLTTGEGQVTLTAPQQQTSKQMARDASFYADAMESVAPRLSQSPVYDQVSSRYTDPLSSDEMPPTKRPERPVLQPPIKGVVYGITSDAKPDLKRLLRESLVEGRPLWTLKQSNYKVVKAIYDRINYAKPTIIPTAARPFIYGYNTDEITRMTANFTVIAYVVPCEMSILVILATVPRAFDRYARFPWTFGQNGHPRTDRPRIGEPPIAMIGKYVKEAFQRSQAFYLVHRRETALRGCEGDDGKTPGTSASKRTSAISDPQLLTFGTEAITDVTRARNIDPANDVIFQFAVDGRETDRTYKTTEIQMSHPTQWARKMRRARLLPCWAFPNGFKKESRFTDGGEEPTTESEGEGEEEVQPTESGKGKAAWDRGVEEDEEELEEEEAEETTPASSEKGTSKKKPKVIFEEPEVPSPSPLAGETRNRQSKLQVEIPPIFPSKKTPSKRSIEADADDSASTKRQKILPADVFDPATLNQFSAVNLSRRPSETQQERPTKNSGVVEGETTGQLAEAQAVGQSETTMVAKPALPGRAQPPRVPLTGEPLRSRFLPQGPVEEEEERDFIADMLANKTEKPRLPLGMAAEMSQMAEAKSSTSSSKLETPKKKLFQTWPPLGAHPPSTESPVSRNESIQPSSAVATSTPIGGPDLLIPGSKGTEVEAYLPSMVKGRAAPVARYRRASGTTPIIEDQGTSSTLMAQGYPPPLVGHRGSVVSARDQDETAIPSTEAPKVTLADTNAVPLEQVSLAYYNTYDTLLNYFSRYGEVSHPKPEQVTVSATDAKALIRLAKIQARTEDATITPYFESLLSDRRDIDDMKVLLANMEMNLTNKLARQPVVMGINQNAKLLGYFEKNARPGVAAGWAKWLAGYYDTESVRPITQQYLDMRIKKEDEDPDEDSDAPEETVQDQETRDEDGDEDDVLIISD
ncbi:hypothetical protein LTS08_000679 [Lithohypha guttulata]|nr:hypothetical protein LTS08_000679 [Lithohypha guttulata]